MDTEKLKILMKVLEEGNFTKTADDIGYTQSSVSQSIRALEKLMGIPLLIRGKRESHINPAAEEVIPYIKEMLESEEKLIQTAGKIAGLERGTINFACLTSVSVHWLPILLKHYAKLHPNIVINICDGNYEQIENWIYEGKMDCGILSKPKKAKIQTKILKTERLLAVFPANHRFANSKQISVHELISEPFIMPGEGMAYDLGRLINENHVKLNIKYSVAEDYVTLSMIRNGLGFSILPELMVLGIENGISKVRLKEKAERTLCLGSRSEEKCSPAARDFISFIKMNFSNIFDEIRC